MPDHSTVPKICRRGRDLRFGVGIVDFFNNLPAAIDQGGNILHIMAGQVIAFSSAKERLHLRGKKKGALTNQYVLEVRH